MARVVHFEVPTSDAAASRKFYENVFGWKFNRWEGPMEYYLISTGEGVPYKVHVRAPGIRAELCWDTVGSNGDNDVDIHFARLQGNNGCSTHGWFLPCGDAPNADDCYYSSSSGCTSGKWSDSWKFSTQSFQLASTSCSSRCPTTRRATS